MGSDADARAASPSAARMRSAPETRVVHFHVLSHAEHLFLFFFYCFFFCGFIFVRIRSRVQALTMGGGVRLVHMVAKAVVMRGLKQIIYLKAR